MASDLGDLNTITNAKNPSSLAINFHRKHFIFHYLDLNGIGTPNPNRKQIH